MTRTLSENILELLITDFDVERHQATTDTPYEQLDFDSLTLAEIAVKLTSTYDVEVSEDDLHAHGSPARTAALLLSRGVTTEHRPHQQP
ncbi:MULTISPECIES: acyl carrier protein [unclassified Crossiella]|uniref:acyl carrier protein n=1 Tax=unclassified Crossiella TaxID=2620835 RepID=UPI001FFF6CBF|nr:MULTISPECIES: acyl carrier protein [unclassified Crossiella]MCK2240019.1 acyl carrier protein [Crossiella sp. S99.2]MCK2252727.1 acyl carrier protein [Crossiella sp. S99.1]